jgi:UDP-N-acetylglucosamine 1-carboxyvinyltransferase
VQQIVVQGGRALQGRVEVSGAKNAALPLMVAALLTDGLCDLANVPALDDVRTMSTLLQRLGVRIQALGDGKMRHRLRVGRRHPNWSSPCGPRY